MSKAKRVRISFYGAAGTVTGSKYLVEGSQQRVLVDCGLFQGKKELRLRNRDPLPDALRDLDAVFLTHAHLDHSGYLPVLVAKGYTGPVYCTEATRDLCEVLLLDAAKLQEEEAVYMNNQGISRYHPAVPLFDSGDAKRALLLFEPVDFKKEIKYGSVTASFHANGHILGSAFIDLVVDGKHILFSGDLGRPHDLLMRPPDAPAYCDYLVLESTYGDRTHFSGDIKERLKDIVRETISRGGSVLIPAFAVGRSQAVLHVLHELRKERSIPHTPVYLDSPMAIQATEIFYKHHTLHKLSLSECQNMFSNIHFLKTVEQSMALNHVEGPSIIISASGMATGGRVLYHLKRMLDSDRNTIVFPGYQASGTRGARLVAGEQSVKIQGQFYPVEADIENLDFISAHADRDEIFHWLRKIPAAPKKCFITHGEKQASRALEQAIEEQMGWPASTPGLEDSVEI